jgi:uncharacterized protein
MIGARRVVRIAFLIILFSCAAYIMYCGFFFFTQREFYFPGRRFHRTMTANPPQDTSVIWLEHDGYKVESWFIPPNHGTYHDSFPVIIVVHGNGGIMYSWPERCKALREMGVGVLLVEYPGYGRSGGDPSYESITFVLVKAYDILVTMPRVDMKNIYAFGYSFGGAAVCTLARHRGLKALILLSTFTSLYDMAMQNALPPFLVLDDFDSLKVLREYDGPVLILHATDDTIIPFHHGELLARAAKNAKFVVLTGGHVNQIKDWDLFWRKRVHDFLKLSS